MNESARQGIFILGCILIPPVMIGLCHSTIYETLIVIGMGGIIMKLTDIQEAIRR